MSEPTPPRHAAPPEAERPPGDGAPGKRHTRGADRLAKAQKAWEVASDFVDPRTLALLGLALIVGFVALFGGLGEVATNEKPLPVVKPGEGVHAAPFDIAVLRASQGARLGTIAYPSDGVRYLFVTVRARLVDSDDPTDPVIQNALSLSVEGLSSVPSRTNPGEQLLNKPGVYRLSDAHSGDDLQPGLDYDLVFVWEQDTSVPAPTELQVTVSKFIYRRSSLSGGFEWTDESGIATVTVPVTALAGA